MLRFFHNQLTSSRTSSLSNKHLLFTGLFFLLTLYGIFATSEYSNLREEDLVKKKLVLSSDPARQQSAKPKGRLSYSLVFYCQGISKEFVIAGSELDCLDWRFEDEVHRGDTVTLWLTEDDYEEVNEETFFSEWTKVINVESRGIHYIGLSCRNGEQQNSAGLGLTVGLMGTILFAALAFVKSPPGLYRRNMIIVLVVALIVVASVVVSTFF